MEKQENVRGRKGKMEKYFLLVPFCPVLSRSDGIDAAELADEITHIAESRIIGDLLQRMFRMKQIVRGRFRRMNSLTGMPYSASKQR